MKESHNQSYSQKPKTEKNQPKSNLNSFAKYSALGFQMGAIIGLTTWGGIKLDQKTGTETPWFTIFLSLFGVVAAIYAAIKDFIKRP